MNFKTVIFLSIASVFLSGCMATADGLVKDANDVLSKLRPSAGTQKQPINNAQDYAAFAKADALMAEKIADHQAAAGLYTQTATRKITVRNARSPSSAPQTVTLTASFRVELPADAVSARHQAVRTTIAALAEYCLLRQTQEPTHLVLVAHDESELAWMQSAATETLDRHKASLPIDTTLSAANKPVAIGWASHGALDRTL